MPPGRPKLRRAHKKSRHGCHTCKRRHTKCDERRPSCVNCVTAHLQCSYLETGLPRPSPLTPESASSSLLPTSTTSTVSTPDIHLEAIETPTPHQSPYQFPVNMHHMELLGHFLTVTSHSLGDPSGLPTSFLQCILKHAFTTLYLMYEILAIAASHLSQLRPTQQKHYQDASTDLQTQALSLFNNDPLDVHAGNCISKFLFSSFLGIHVFFNTISTSSNDADLLDKFIAYLDIHRGVRAITATSWQMLKETELEPILRAGENNIQPRAEEYRECDRLTALLESSDLSSPYLEECRNALEQLRGLFGSKQCQRDSQDLNFVFAWPIIISGEYTKLLLRRQPEALIILAYYAVLLHARRRVWIIGDAGRALIESITMHLGTYWKQWLAWPNEMLSMHA